MPKFVNVANAAERQALAKFPLKRVAGMTRVAAFKGALGYPLPTQVPQAEPGTDLPDPCAEVAQLRTRSQHARALMEAGDEARTAQPE